MTSLDDQTQVRGKSTTVASTSSLLVGVGSGHVVGELARAHEHLALVVGPILVLDLLGHRLRLVYGVGDTDEIAPGNAVKGVACRADLAVDLVASPDAATRIRRGEVT